MAAAEEVTRIWHTKSATYWKLLVCFPSPYTVNGCLRMACKRQTQELKITVNDNLLPISKFAFYQIIILKTMKN